jgi:PAS domain S-box-containing protein
LNYSKKSKDELIKEIENLKSKDYNTISEERFNILSNATSEVIIIHDKGTIVDVNNSVKEVFGYEPNELIGENITKLTTTKTNDRVKNNGLSNKYLKYEAEGLRKDGTVFYGEVISKSIDFKGKKIKVATVRDITDKKIVEDHLKENEKRYKNLFTKNLAGVFITEGGIIIECNNSLAKIFGFKSRVELIGKNANDLYFNNNDRDKYIVDLKKNNQLTNYIIRHKNKNGDELWISTNVSIYYLEDNKYRVEGTLVDITKEIEIEKQLLESRENYKKLIDNSPYATLIHINGEIVFANKKSFQFLGLKSFDDLKGKLNLFDYLPIEYQEDALIRRGKVMSGEEIPFIELKIKKPLTNEIIDIETRSTIIDYKGEKAIHLVFQDISDRKKLEKEQLKFSVAEASNKTLKSEIIERKKIEKKLINSQKYTNSIINSSLDIICASDKNGKIIEFNHAAEQAFGFKEKEVLGKGISIIYESKSDFIKISKELKSKNYFVGEVKNKRKNRELFTSFISASTLYDDDNNIIGTMGVSRDITELKEAEEQLIESEDRYRDLFENASDLIQSLDMHGNILYVNNAWKETLGYTDDEIINKNIFEFIHNECKDKCKNHFNDLLNSTKGKSLDISFDLETKKGKKIIVKGNVGLKFKDGKPHSTRGILRNITKEEWKKSLQTTYNNIAKIVTETTVAEDIYEGIRIELGKVINTDVFTISYLLDNNTISFPYYYDITRNGRIIVEKRKQKKGLNEYIIKESKPLHIYKEDLRKLIKSKKIKLYGPEAEAFIGVPLKIKNKIIGILSVQSYINKNEYNAQDIEVLEFISGILALTVQRKQDENIIHNQSAKLKAIIENSTHLFWTYNDEKGVTSSNKNFVKYIEENYSKKVEIEVNSKKKLTFSDKNQQFFWNKKYKKAFEGESQYFISSKKDNNGREIIKEVYLNPIYDEKGKISEISGIAHDITEKTLSEKQLKESLSEKEVLLKEVHHRVKNNLQVISSILNLQSSYVKDENTLNILRESQNRIKSMSFIHESLYKTDDFSKINFSEYISSLSKNLVHSYGIYDNLIDLDLSLEEVFLNLDLSIPCGLIINELVSNALKYAFTDNTKGIIKIKLLEKKGLINLIVADNGLGLPNNINYRETDSLGLQLVMTLAEQIDAKVILDNTKGAKYTIIFKKDQ